MGSRTIRRCRFAELDLVGGDEVGARRVIDAGERSAYGPASGGVRGGGVEVEEGPSAGGEGGGDGAAGIRRDGRTRRIGEFGGTTNEVGGGPDFGGIVFVTDLAIGLAVEDDAFGAGGAGDGGGGRKSGEMTISVS